jgi:hypothetical protein
VRREVSLFARRRPAGTIPPDWGNPEVGQVVREMLRLALTILSGLLLARAAAGQDLPLISKLVERQLREELTSHDSQERSWYHEKSVNREKWTSGKVFGKKTRLASWTEQSKTWFWMQDPRETLTLEVRRLAVRDARLEFALALRGKAGFNVWGRIPKLVRASASGTAQVDFEIEGSTAMKDGGLADSQISRLAGRLTDLRFNSDFGHPFEDLVKDALNDYI